METQAKTEKNSQQLPVPENWAGWCDHLKTRKKPKPLVKLIRHSNSVLTWPLEDAWHGSDSEKLVRRLEQIAHGEKNSNGRLAQQLESWLEDAADQDSGVPLAIESVAWAHALPYLSQTLPAAPWYQLLEQLIQLSQESTALDVPSGPLLQQLMAGELPLTLAYHFPELDQCRCLGDQAGSALSDVVLELLDGEGMPEGRYLNISRPLLSVWTRCGYLDKAMDLPTFSEDAWLQLEWFIRQTLRLTRYDGSLALSQGLSGAACTPLLRAALDLFADQKDRRLANAILPTKEKRRRRGSGMLPPTSVNAEWARVGILRCMWTPESDHLVVRYNEPDVVSELNSNGHTIWSGPITTELQLDGRRTTAAGNWEEVCWESDKDVDYLELELRLPEGRRIQRQMMLAREDRFLFLSDAILGDQPVETEYSITLPLQSSVRFRPATDTREGFLSAKRRMGLVLPLALPEWRSERAAGELDMTADGLQLRMRGHARNLLAPLFIDLDPKRIKKQITWRRLTVAERLEIQPPENAVGYRVQVGVSQWLIYRSLTERGNRSVLGQNFSTEFVAAQFSREGEIEKLVEIE